MKRTLAAALMILGLSSAAPLLAAEVQSVALLSAMETPDGAARQWKRILKKTPELQAFTPVYEQGLVGLERNMVSLRVAAPMEKLRPLCKAITDNGFECLMYEGGMPKKSPFPVKKRKK